jgi:hypothetical protein
VTACTLCQRPTDDREPVRHDRCANRLRADLVAIPGLYALMGAVLAPGTAGGARVSGTRTAPLPVRLEPLSQIGPGGMVTTLTLWERHVREERGLSAATERGLSARDLAAMVLFLRAQLPWMIEHYTQVVKFGYDLQDIVHTCRAAAGILPNMMRVGDCPNPLADDEPCGVALYADAYAEQIQCRWCKRTWFRPQWVPLGKKLRGIEDEEAETVGTDEMVLAASDSVVLKLSEGSVDFQGAEVSSEVAELAKVLNEPSGWSERLSA